MSARIVFVIRKFQSKKSCNISSSWYPWTKAIIYNSKARIWRSNSISKVSLLSILIFKICLTNQNDANDILLHWRLTSKLLRTPWTLSDNVISYFSSTCARTKRFGSCRRTYLKFMRLSTCQSIASNLRQKELSSAPSLKTVITTDTKRRIKLTSLRLHARCPDVAVMTRKILIFIRIFHDVVFVKFSQDVDFVLIH